MAFLDLHAVSKRFAAVTAVRDVSLAVTRGQFVALLGPSGCGKTTLLRMIAGLERPSAGRIVLDGQDITGLPPEARRLAMMFQSYALLPHMTALENVRFPLRMRRQGRPAEQRARARDALALVKLDQLADRLPRAMSGGQQQRVALARAIVAEPRILLLDEPLSNLDARLREDMQIELQTLHGRLGLTTLLVTHDQEEALSLADRVVLMRGGAIERDAAAGDLYDDPGTPFAADFLGAANLVPVTVADGAARLPGGQVLPPSAPAPPRPGTAALVLRQEDLLLLPAGDPLPQGMIGLEGTIDARIFLGTRVRYLVRAGGVELRILTPRQQLLAPAAEVLVVIDPALVRWTRAAGS